MKKISTETMVRTIVLAFALLNQVLTMFGVNPLPFSAEEVYQGCTALLTVVSSLWAWWKNNSFTEEAIRADEYLERLREGDDPERTIGFKK